MKKTKNTGPQPAAAGSVAFRTAQLAAQPGVDPGTLPHPPDAVDDAGAKAIVLLQSAIGIEWTYDRAMEAWRGFTPEMKQKTIKALNALGRALVAPC